MSFEGPTNDGVCMYSSLDGAVEGREDVRGRLWATKLRVESAAAGDALLRCIEVRQCHDAVCIRSWSFW